MQTPNIKYFDIEKGSDVRNPPNNKDPSIIAWGLSHVTAKLVTIDFIKDWLTPSLSVICEVERIKPIPI